MRRCFLLIAALATPVSSASAGALPAIHIAGDSTAQTYSADRYPMTGWGQMIRCGLGPGVEIRNHAIAGRSTKTFIEEGRLDRIAAEIKRGDTLLIQFGHNDANTVRPGRYAAPAGAYRDNLVKMVSVARSGGAQPVLITPVIRRNFVDGQVRADFRDWSGQVRKLASELKVPLIDLEAESAAWVQRAGEQGSRRYYVDDTHFSEFGARGVAEIIARRLRGLKLPVSRHVLPARPALTRTEPLGSTACA